MLERCLWRHGYPHQWLHRLRQCRWCIKYWPRSSYNLDCREVHWTQLWFTIEQSRALRWIYDLWQRQREPDCQMDGLPWNNPLSFVRKLSTGERKLPNCGPKLVLGRRRWLGKNWLQWSLQMGSGHFQRNGRKLAPRRLCTYLSSVL